MLQASASSLVQHVRRLHCLTDNIALLDMLCAFAMVACSSSGPYVRPKMTAVGPIAIVDGRHALLENEDDNLQVSVQALASSPLQNLHCELHAAPPVKHACLVFSTMQHFFR